MTSFPDFALEVLRRNQFRITEPRKAVVAILDEAPLPLSPYDISKHAQKRRLDTVTVYRVLETLETLGLVHRILSSGKFRKCEKNEMETLKTCHHLVVCEKCGAISELAEHPHIQNVIPPKGFVITGHHLEFLGLCQGCANT
jgi:Fe2+ or Zn2+ uptake regulation protein